MIWLEERTYEKKNIYIINKNTQYLCVASGGGGGGGGTCNKPLNI
jgi:hypothetical protein